MLVAVVEHSVPDQQTKAARGEEIAMRSREAVATAMRTPARRRTDEAAVQGRRWKRRRIRTGGNCKIHLTNLHFGSLSVAPTYPDFGELRQSRATSRNVKDIAYYGFSQRFLRVTIPLKR